MFRCRFGIRVRFRKVFFSLPPDTGFLPIFLWFQSVSTERETVGSQFLHAHLGLKCEIHQVEGIR